MTHQPGSYICKWCKPKQVRAGAHGTMDPEYRRDWNLRRRYGISAEDYDRMLAAQGGVCAICLRPQRNRRLYVDHDHVTGRVRGLLCVTCNSRIEWFESYHDAVTSFLGAGDMSPSTY